MRNIILLTMISLLTTACDSKNSDRGEEEKEIQTRMSAYAELFQSGDAKSISGFWSEDAEYESPFSGRKLKGREDIASHFAQMFEEMGGVSLDIKIDRFDWLSGDKVVEYGTATVKKAGEPSTESQFQATLVKENDEWLLQNVDEQEESIAPSHFDKLKELSWLEGAWEVDDENADIKIQYKWDRNKNFLIQTFQVSIPGLDPFEGKQIIGYDPVNEKIRSWLFDSDGGFGEGTWELDGERFIVRSKSVLPDGGQGTSVQTFRRVNDSNYAWKSTDRQVDGELLPNVEETIMKKVGS